MTAVLILMAVLVAAAALIALYALWQRRTLKFVVKVPGGAISLEAGDCPKERTVGLSASRRRGHHV
jgi:hypothetical protein